MTTEYFEELVRILEGSVLGRNARKITALHCKFAGKTPETLNPDDGGKIVIDLMANISCLLFDDEWEVLDEEMKGLVNSNAGKLERVKGSILTIVFDYIADISMKKSTIEFREVIKNLKVPHEIQDESWYPIDFLEEILSNSEKVIGHDEHSLSKTMGDYIVENNLFFQDKFPQFCQTQAQLEEALANMDDIFELNNFIVEKHDDQELVLSFNSDKSEYFQEFLMGMCEGLCNLRDECPVNFCHSRENGMTIISFKLKNNGGNS
jgi:hypothetical protein